MINSQNDKQLYIGCLVQSVEFLDCTVHLFSIVTTYKHLVQFLHLYKLRANRVHKSINPLSENGYEAADIERFLQKMLYTKQHPLSIDIRMSSLNIYNQDYTILPLMRHSKTIKIIGAKVKKILVMTLARRACAVKRAVKIHDVTALQYVARSIFINNTII